MWGKIQILRKGLYFFKEYFWHSEQRISALFMLFACVLCITGIVTLVVFMPWVLGGFWSALIGSNLPLFGVSLAKFAGIVVGLVLTHSIKDYLTGILTIRWREWLTKRFLGRFLQESDPESNNYLDLARLPNVAEHPQQRIQEDIHVVTQASLSGGLDFLLSLGRLGAFVGSLWVVGGTLTFIVAGATITIPGYLVLAAIAFATIVTLIKRGIGRKLTSIMHEQQKTEADFRSEAELLMQQAESIALEKGENYYQNSFTKKLAAIRDNTLKKLAVQTLLNGFQNVTSFVSILLPYVAAAPLYFMGLMDMDKLMQVSVYFGEVSTALGWFATSYEPLSELENSLIRLADLEEAMTNPNKTNPTRAIVVEKSAQEHGISIHDLALAKPEQQTQDQSTRYILQQFSLRLVRGEHTLIQGPSGLGKSTLFKALSGNWRYGLGRVRLPTDTKIMFLAQKTTLPYTSLREVLAYPERPEQHPDHAYIQILEKTGLQSFIAELDTVARWANRFSGGQQQRIAFARALLQQPDWLFLDETTASLDSESEAQMYTMLGALLPNTTLVSIAHRASTRKYHQRVVDMSKPDETSNFVLHAN